MDNLELALVINVQTGNIPVEVTLFTIEIPHLFIPVWQQAGVFEELYVRGYYHASEGFKMSTSQLNLTLGLIHIAAFPDLYLGKMDGDMPIIEQGGVDWYHQAIYMLAHIINACTKYPLSTIRINYDRSILDG